MNVFYTRLLRLNFGLFLYALGIVVTMNANIGYTAWDVFQAGLSTTTGISIGNASIVVGVVIGIVTVSLGEKLGLGTILNMVLIGVFLDILLNLKIIPVANSFLIGILMLSIGLFIIALASYFYIESAFGAGPRDSLMVVITRKTKLPIGVCRGALEFTVALLGWKLGGMLGIGTIISAFLIGLCIQITFKILKFDATKVQHETLDQTYRTLLGLKSLIDD